MKEEMARRQALAAAHAAAEEKEARGQRQVEAESFAVKEEKEIRGAEKARREVIAKREASKEPLAPKQLAQALFGAQLEDLPPKSREAALATAKKRIEALTKAIPSTEKATEFTRQAWQGITPWKEEEGEKATPKGAAIMAAELVVPGVFVARHWNELTPGERAAFIAIDAITVLLPFYGAVTRGAKTVGVAGRAARLAMVAKEVGREAITQVRVPIDMVIHPVGAVKAGVREVRNLAETIADPRKLPEAVITTSHSTVRLKVTEATSPAEAMAIRDKLMELAAKGERPIIQVGDQTIELTRSPLMRELEGGLAHATPSGEGFEAGLKVATKPGMPAREQGLFVSHEPLPRFAEASAFGKVGDKPTIIITSRETAAKAISSAKIYDSPVGKVAEMERKFPIGAEIPAANQRLFTRIGPTSQHVEIWLEKPLSVRQIAKLKAEGLIEGARGIFREPIRIKGEGGISGLTRTEVERLNQVLKEAGNLDQARNLLRVERLTGIGRRAAPTLARFTRGITPREAAGAREKIEREIPERPEAERAEVERVERERPEAERERLNRERPESERDRLERERPEAERTRAERERPEAERTRAERERPESERQRTERERAETERERITRERAETERERPERERLERERPRTERQRIERERIETERERLERERPRSERERIERGRERIEKGRTERERLETEKTRIEKTHLLPKGVSDEEKRELIRQTPGAVTWNMGKLGRKNPEDIWWVRLPDGKQLVLRGKPPEGAKILADGKGSAYKTTQTIGGQLRRAITQQHGAVKVTITPSRTSKGAEARFAPTGLRSIKRGKQYFTPMGGGVAISRRPLGRRRRK